MATPSVVIRDDAMDGMDGSPIFGTLHELVVDTVDPGEMADRSGVMCFVDCFYLPSSSYGRLPSAYSHEFPMSPWGESGSWTIRMSKIFVWKLGIQDSAIFNESSAWNSQFRYSRCDCWSKPCVLRLLSEGWNFISGWNSDAATILCLMALDLHVVAV